MDRVSVLSLFVMAFFLALSTSFVLAQEGKSRGILEISFDFTRQRTIASNQYAVWIEDAQGNLVKTLFVTGFTGRGGYLRRPDCLPTWVKRANPASWTPQEIDTVTGATPKSGTQLYTWDGRDEKGNFVLPGTYRFVIEATLYWSSRVLITGIFTYGGESVDSIPIKVEHFGGKENEGMITNVRARYQALRP